MAKKRIMSWSKCLIEIGTTGNGDVFAASVASIGTIKDKSSSLEATDGDVLEAKATGGETVAKEQLEGGYSLTTRVIEPDDELLQLLGLGSIDAEELKIQTHVVEGDWSVKVTPKNIGAKGIKAPKCSITYKPGWSEEEGDFADLTFEILKGDAGYWYSKFRKKGSLVVDVASLSFTNAADTSGKKVTVTSSGAVTAQSSDDWCTVTVSGKVVTVKVTANTGAERTANVIITADGKEKTVTVTQAATA